MQVKNLDNGKYVMQHFANCIINKISSVRDGMV